MPLSFDDLIPKQGTAPIAPPAGGGLSFDDLIPQKTTPGASFAERFDAAPDQSIGPLADYFASLPRGLLQGVAGAASAAGQTAQIEMGQPVDVPSGTQAADILEKNVTGPLPVPQGMAGRFGAATGEALGNPASYVGPGGPLLKFVGAALSGTGGQAGEETGIPGARFAGSLLGGAAAAKTAGPAIERAATPTYRELQAAYKQNYNTAVKQSGLELSPKSLSNDFAYKAEQHLQSEGFDPSLPIYSRLQSIQTEANNPQAVSVTAGNLDALRKYLGRAARETQEGKPTPNAAAASIALDHYNNYLENLPPSSVLAGDAKTFMDATKEGNANYAAAQRLRVFDQKVMAAERASSGGIATSLDNQLKSKTRQLLDRGQVTDTGEQRIRGYTPEEQSQAELVNSGNWWSNMLRQPGRLATGVLPMMFHTGLATHTGGASIPLQILAEAGLYGAKKGAELATVNRAQKLADMLAQRSPLYQQRLAAQPPVNYLPGTAALARGGILGLQ